MITKSLQKNHNVSLYHDTRRAKSNGKFPVKLRVYTNNPRIQKLYQTQYEFTKEDFSSIWLTSRPRKEFKSLRIKLAQFEAHAVDIADSLNPFTFEEFERKFNRKPGSGNLVSYHFQCAIEEKKRSGSYSTAQTYELSQKSFIRYLRMASNQEFDKLTFSQISKIWLDDYERYIIEAEGSSLTTVGIYTRVLKAVFNRAIDLKDIDSDCYPFGKRKYVTPSSAKSKRALTGDQLKTLYYSKPENQFQRKAKDFWLFSYVCNGMNFKDIAELRWSDFVEDGFQFHRAKTSVSNRVFRKSISVYLNEFSNYVLDKYANERDDSGYVFPILNDGLSEKQKHQKAKAFTRFVNQHIKKLAKKNGLPQEISTYWARHTYATISVQKGRSMEFIQENLGHSNIKTTQIYFNGFDDQFKKEHARDLLAFDEK